MIPSKSSALEKDVSELKTLVNNLLDKVNRLTSENTRLREEIRHLKKLKGKHSIRLNTKEPEDGKDGKPKSGSGNTQSPKKLA